MMAVNRHGDVFQYLITSSYLRRPFSLFVRSAVCTSNVVAYAASGRALSPRAGSQGGYLCAGTNFRNGCLFGTSMLINGRLGRQLSLVLSGIAKGRGAGFLLVMTRSAKMMADRHSRSLRRRVLL